MADKIPLFPLGSILFPTARMALQIFEPRYVDLVKHCLKTDSGFGVVLITKGGEVAAPVTAAMPQLVPTGCYAKIVDWDAAPNNKFQIIIEGQSVFHCGEMTMAKDNLISSEVMSYPTEEEISVPAQFGEHGLILQNLLEHPQLAKLGFDVDVNDAYRLSMQLAQVLPITEQEKLPLLECGDIYRRLELIDKKLDELSA